MQPKLFRPPQSGLDPKGDHFPISNLRMLRVELVVVGDRPCDYMLGGAFIEEMGFCPGAERPTVK
ncbi:MAG: hypothetical protein LZF62_140015 [Nitrospira sp.]|nr:MAG: hypothetical protein LZF62_140015 [Nitrospira sp.]